MRECFFFTEVIQGDIKRKVQDKTFVLDVLNIILLETVQLNRCIANIAGEDITDS